jgi:MFS family permease
LRTFGTLAYAVRASRGFFALNLPVSDTVRRDFRLDLLGGILFGVFNGSVISYLYVVARTIGVSPIGISVLVAMPAIGAILAMPLSLAIRGDGGRPFMFIAWGSGRAIILLLLVFGTPTPYALIASIFLITTSVAMPQYAAIMQHVYPREFRGRLMSLVRVGGGTATTITSLLVAWLLGSLRVNFAIVFAVGAILAILSLVVFAKITPVRAQPRPRQSYANTFALLKVNPPFARYQLWIFFLGLGNIMAATLYPLVIVDKLHAGYGAFGVLAVVTALGYLGSFFLWGRVIDRLGTLFTMFSIGALVLIPPLGMMFAPNVFWLTPVALVTGIISAGFEIVVYAAVIHYAAATPLEVPRYMALHSIFSGLRGLVGPFAATLILAGHHYAMSLTSAIAIAAAGTYMLWRMFQEETRTTMAAGAEAEA